MSPRLAVRAIRRAVVTFLTATVRSGCAAGRPGATAPDLIVIGLLAPTGKSSTAWVLTVPHALD